MTSNRPTLLLYCLLTLLPMAAQTTGGSEASCPLVRMEVEHLSSLNIPRNGHNVFRSGDEIVAVGGHTAGFVPTATAEYFSEGKWHLLQMAYTHDGGFVVPMKSGKVLIAGGFEKSLGIGQTYTAEMYDPVSHTFTGFTCLDQKRALAAGIELDSGKVYIAGNWYADDAIEQFDGQNTFTHVKPVTTGRASPYLFLTSDHDALILSGRDVYDNAINSAVVDRMRGDSLCVPLLEEWQPLHFDSPNRCDDSFIGNKASGDYAYLFAARNEQGQIAIIQVRDTSFTLLPTVCPIPTSSRWGPVCWISNVIVNRQAGRAYLVGNDNRDLSSPDKKDWRYYVLSIEYAQARAGHPAPLTLYYSDPQPETGSVPILTADGNIMIVGGASAVKNPNFFPQSSVCLLRIGQAPTSPSTASGSRWIWLFAGLLAVAGLTVWLLYRRRSDQEDRPSPAVMTASPTPPIAVTRSSGEQLMQRIREQVEQNRLYLDSSLKLTDVAGRLGTHRNNISACIKAQEGCSFSQYVGRLRIAYAQQLMRQNPLKKIATVYLEAGFINETSFYRTFKAQTGITPKEWIEKKMKEID